MVAPPRRGDILIGLPAAPSLGAAALKAAATVEVQVIPGAMIPVMEQKTSEVAEAVLDFLGRFNSVQVDARAKR